MNNRSSQQTIEALCKLLADSYTLYLKTHNYHWNVTGPMFTQFHTLFEEQYTELAGAIDEIAERIRALGAKAPGSFSDFMKLGTVKEDTSHPDAMQMVRNLAADHETIAASALKVVSVAEEVDDAASADLGTRRQDAHEKNAWMLRSHLE